MEATGAQGDLRGGLDGHVVGPEYAWLRSSPILRHGLRMRALLALAFALCVAPPLAAHQQLAAVPEHEIVRTELETDGGLVGAFFKPPGAEVRPGILLLGGSEGGWEAAGRVAQPLAAQGYVVLAVAYFGADGLPATLEEVPLEYFDRAIERLKREPGVDPRRIAVVGGSKGAEAALLIGARRNDLAAIVAVAPSDAVWQGINRQARAPRSSWTSEGRPLPFLAFDRTRPFTSVLDLYRRSRPDTGPGDAAIPIEQISAPLLLIAGESDALWPSADMVRTMARRLRQANFAPEFQHVEFVDAGHAMLGAPVPLDRAETLNADGGTTAGNFHGRQASWFIIQRFLHRNLCRADAPVEAPGGTR
jgi:dienelactone hydrolase